MNDDPVLAAVQQFMDAVEVRLSAHTTEIRGLLSELETRATPQVIEGPPGPAGKDGANGIDGKNGVDGKDGAPGIGEKGERGADGLNGKDGAPSTVPGPKGDTGDRGADGIATRAELEVIAKELNADLHVLNLADSYQGTFDQAKTYGRGQIVSWDGQPWLAMAATRATPGLSSDWKLFAKKGRDGRDKSK